MKTPMQILIDKMQIAYERGDKKYKPSLKHFIEEAKRLRDVEEKQMIIEAVEIIPFHTNGEQYYNEKYTG